VTSQAVKIRDRRRLPFVMVTKVALEAIRDGFDPRARPMALSVYLSVVECANEVRSDVFEASRESIVKRGRFELKALEKYVPELARLGLLHVESGIGRPNQWTLTDPGTPLEGAPLQRGTDQDGATTLNGVAPTPLEGVPPYIGSKKEKKGSTPSGVEPAGTGTGKVDPDSLPPDYPGHLTAVVRQALAVLKRVQSERGGHTPSLRAVALAVGRYPDRDHDQVAGELEHWATVGNGRNRPVRDWPRQYASFLDRSPAGGAPRSSPKSDARSERRARGAAAIDALVAGQEAA
jgi:hypothetical protein